MVNLLTDLKQATSRQRNKRNPNYNTFVYIFNQNNFEKTEQELTNIIDENKKQIEDNCKLLNELLMNGDTRYNSTLKTFKDSVLYKTYSLYDEDRKHYINELAFSADRYFILETRKQFEKGFNVMGAFDNEPLIIDAPKERNPFSYDTLLYKYKESLINDSVTFTDEEKATENYQTIDLYYKQYKTFTENGSYARKMLKATGNEWLKMYTELHYIVGKRRYQWKELKTILEAIYLKHGMNRKPKETDLDELGFEYQIKKVHGYKNIDIL